MTVVEDAKKVGFEEGFIGKGRFGSQILQSGRQ